MKRLVFVLVVMIFCLEAQVALCQVKSDFSDWNVPPPMPAGTIPKGPGATKQTIILQLTDVAAPGLQLIDLKMAALSPVLQTAPEVSAPEQPQFPSLPFSVPDIPLPQIPAAMALPKQTPHDQINESSTDMPEPVAPEMPVLPKMPGVNQNQADEGVLKLPLIPAILNQPGSAAVPADAFPFWDWPVPEIPENSQMNIVPSDNPADDSIKHTIKKKTAKKVKGG